MVRPTENPPELSVDISQNFKVGVGYLQVHTVLEDLDAPLTVNESS